MACAARAVDNGDGLLFARRYLLGRGFCSVVGRAGRRHRGFFVRRRRLADGDTDSWFAAQWIVVEQGKADKGNQEQAKQHGKRLGRRKRQPQPALSFHRRLSERRAQIVGRLCHGPPRINRLTIPRRAEEGGGTQAAAAGSEALEPQQKGWPGGRPLHKTTLAGPGTIT